MKYKKRIDKVFYAFTLTELLIAMIVLGIIAVYTVPLLLQMHKRSDTASMLKKFFGTLDKAVRLAETNNSSPIYEWGENSLICGDYNMEKTYFEEHFSKYINAERIGKLSDSGTYFSEVSSNLPNWVVNLSANNLHVYLNDGSSFFFTGCNNVISYDVNGDRSPNVLGRDIFTIYTVISNDTGKDSINDDFPHVNTYSNSMTEILNLNSNITVIDKKTIIDSCKNNKLRCTYLVQMDGWNFEDDYPFRL